MVNLHLGPKRTWAGLPALVPAATPVAANVAANGYVGALTMAGGSCSL